MFDTCSSANRIVTRPLLTTFTRSYVMKSSGTQIDYYLYTRIRRAAYKYVGCTKACAVAKAKELNLLFNRYRPLSGAWKRGTSVDSNHNYYSFEKMPFSSADKRTNYGFKQCGTATVNQSHGDSYDVEVDIDEELSFRYIYSLDGSVYDDDAWTAFEANPDIANPYLRADAAGDFEYDGII